MVGKAVRIALLGCALAALVVGRPAIAGEVTITFERIADTDTLVPFLGGAKREVTFQSLGAPTLEDGLVAFYGYHFPSDPFISGEGVYTYQLDDGTVHLVADGLTPFPDGVGNIVQFTTPSVGAFSVAFSAFGVQNQQGIYTASGAGGQLQTVADRSTQDPGGNGLLRHFFTVSRSGTAVGFTAITSFFVHGVYAHVGDVRLVANNFTPIPGGEGLFLAFGFNVTISNDVVAFLGGDGAGYWGIFTGTLPPSGGSSLKVVADTGTRVPGGNGTFSLFSDRPSIADGQVAFWGRGDAGQEGIYATRGDLHRVADLSTPVPDGAGTFTAFGFGQIGSPYGPSMSKSGRVVFRGEGVGGQVGLYVEIGASLYKIVDLDDQLDDEAALVSLFLEPECQDGNLVGFVASFSDSSSAVYLAAVSLLGDLTPDEFSAFRGFYDSGDLDSLLESDDDKLCYEPGIVLNQDEAPVTLDFTGTLPNDSPATLDVTIESSANTIGLELTFSFWNYNTASWDVVGMDTQALNEDTVRTFAGTPADHVQPGTGEVRTRYEVRVVSFIFLFPWLDCVDHVFWTTT